MTQNQGTTSPTTGSNFGALSALITVFFFWGFVAASNDILIPVFKDDLNLTHLQSQMVAFAFYIAYTVGSLIYYFVSQARGGDILNKIGYKNGIALGLLISALGTLLFIPAASQHSFNLFITGLFIVGLGFSLQQTAANPLAIVMGDPRTGSQRLSLAGGINNFGTTIGPVILSFVIFGAVSEKNNEADISSIKIPYLVLGAVFIIVALIIRASSVPNKIETVEDDTAVNAAHTDKKSAFSYPQLILGMIAIFVYVGVEVSTVSNLPEFLKKHCVTEDGNPFTNDLVAPFVALFWASMMLGRWTSATEALNLKASTTSILRIIMPFIGFVVFLVVNAIAGHPVQQFLIYTPVIVAMIIANILSKGNPVRQILIYSACGIIALCIGMMADGMVSAYAFISVGLFCSTLWPCIFTVAIAGLGKHTNTGSSLLIMMIMGGAFIPLLQGFMADKVIGIQYSYVIGVLCFLYLAYFAIRSNTILKSQGIDYDRQVAGGH